MSDIYHSNNYTNSFRSADGTGSPVDHDDRTGGWQNVNDPNYRVDRTRERRICSGTSLWQGMFT